MLQEVLETRRLKKRKDPTQSLWKDQALLIPDISLESPPGLLTSNFEITHL
jgi:hypothetical protein